MEWGDSITLSLENDALDQSVAELAGTQPGLSASDPSSQTPWDAQRVLKGSTGDDQFIVERQPLGDHPSFAVSFIATQGSDRYEGTSGQDFAYYGELNNDALSGLYISNKPEELPLVSNNLPPLIAEEFKTDDLLVYKQYSDSNGDQKDEVDRLKNIEVLTLSSGEDVVNLSTRPESLIVNFGEGQDQLIVASTGKQPDVTAYQNLETLSWTPLDSNGKEVLSHPVQFEVHEWLEDQTTLLAVEDYPPLQKSENDSNRWELSTFALPGVTPEPLPIWTELLEIPPTPELVGKGRVVIDHNFITDEKDSSLLWLELSVHDMRTEGQGLVGLELDLDWNSSALELVEGQHTKDKVFNPDHLPLFQNLGKRSSTGSRAQIKGLGAAALPRGGQGLALGLDEELGGQARFARLGFRRQDAEASIDLHLTPTLTPPAGGVKLHSDELLVLDDRSPSVWVLKATPDQPQVGSHAFTLSRGSGDAKEEKHLAIAVREVNDAPIAVAQSPEDLNLSVNQDITLTKNVSVLFTDQDDAALQYSFVDAPSWLQLDATTGAILGLPGNADVGEVTVKVQASDGRGGTAVQTLRIAVRNVNDNPVLGSVALQPPELRQGESFTYRIPNGVFSDPDLLIDPEETLTYSLHSVQPNQDVPGWVKLDTTTGTLSGTAGPADIGDSRFVVRASDSEGLYVEQDVVISVENVNDAPSRTSALESFLALQQPTQDGSDPPSEDNPQALFSGLERTIDLNPWFTDLDLGVDPNERLELTVVLEDKEGNVFNLNESSAQKLKINVVEEGRDDDEDINDKENEDFEIDEDEDIGKNDDDNVDVDLTYNLQDAPSWLTINAKTGEISGLPGKALVEEILVERQCSNQSGNTTSEILSITVETWAAFDQETGVLTLNPSVEEGGQHFLRVLATDNGTREEGVEAVDRLTASALVPLLVRHRNSAPELQITSSEELLDDSVLEGVFSATPKQGSDQQLTGLTLELEEDAEIFIELPASLYSDIDLSIDPAERLTYSFLTEQNLPFKLDPDSLSISGNTDGLGLQAVGGRSSWSTKLLVADAAGETASFDLELILQRSAAEPTLTTILDPEEALWDEGTAVPLAELLDLSLEPRSGEVVELLLERTDSDTQTLQLRNQREQPIPPKADGSWMLRGTAEEVATQLTQLNLVVDNDPHAIGTFALRATATSELGSTGLRSESVTAEIGFSLEPDATPPRWTKHPSEGPKDALALSTFADFFSAELVDPREQLLYAIDLPDTEQELIITDRTGEEIGDREGQEVILTAAEWALAMLRTEEATPKPVNLQVRALSREVSTGIFAEAENTANVNWQPTPLLQEEPLGLAITPDGVQRSGEPTNMSLALIWPDVAQSGQIQIDVPLGTKIELEGVVTHSKEIEVEVEEDGETVMKKKQRFLFTVKTEGDQPIPSDLDFKVTSPETFDGEFEGSFELLSSVRNDLPSEGLSPEALAADQSSGLVSRHASEWSTFFWDVAQVAKTPEFAPDADLFFNADTGAIQIALRRGESSSGYRNPAEALTLSIRNIPTGYTLAERVNGAYRAVGATDAFGTMTLFTLPAAAEDSSAEMMQSYTGLNNNNLFLVSIDGDPTPLTGAQSLSLAVSARISSDQPGGDSRSAAALRQLKLAPFTNESPPRLSQQVDPVILDLGGTGLKLTTLEKGVSFAMLPKAPAIPTAWLSPEANGGGQRNAAFLVVNDTSNDAESGDVTISSITELLSEYFQASGRQRSFTTGSAALASLNSNGDQRLDADDARWSDIKLWFDDGDAVREDGELVGIGDVLSSIDLGSLETLSEQPSWAAGNAVLRRLSGVNLDDPPSNLALYDIGLEVAPAGSKSLDLAVRGPLTLKENGKPATLKLTSPGSGSWQASGQDALTLIRLSGLPDRLMPSLGVKDSRGDWLFTWADLKVAGDSGQLEILTGPDWSGNANLQLLISQLQADGTLKSSELTTLALDVDAVADQPLLQINSTTIKEDAPVALKSLLGRAEITDTDGSETLGFELRGLPAGARIQKKSDEVVSLLEPSSDGIYRITPADLENLFFVPPADIAGQLSFQWHAVAKENNNGSTASTIANVLINVRAVADAPLAPIQASNPPALVEGKKVDLSKLIQQPDATSGLKDTDGSEQLRLEFKLPPGLSLQHKSSETWTPRSAKTLADGQRLFVVDAGDLNKLQLADLGVRRSGDAPDSVQLTVTRISRERTGDQARSETLNVNLIFDRQARPATITLPSSPSAREDDGGIALTELLQAQASQSGDVLSYRLSGMPKGVSLVDAQGKVQAIKDGSPLTLAKLQGWRLRAEEHKAGKFTVDLQVISTPPGQGSPAQSAVQRIEFNIAAVADTPQLSFASTPDAPLQIANNGWLALSALGFKLNTADHDGSERLSVVFQAVDETGNPQNLPSQAQFNVPAQKQIDGSWVVEQTDLEKISLYLGEIADDLSIRITPRSKDGNSLNTGEATAVKIKANAVVRVPLLEVRGVMEGLEDKPLPLLSRLEGVINAQLRGNGAGQTLELELTDLPQGSLLVAANKADEAGSAQSFSAALNRDELGQLTTKLRLPYSQWSNVYWQGPADQTVNSLGKPFTFKVQAFSVGKNGKTLASEIEDVRVLLTAVNDAPRIVNVQDLTAIDEGTPGTWDLRARFTDIDNALKDLVITAKQVAEDGSTAALPTWLSLDNQGVLKGTPSNTDVGVLKLEIKAEDPLGQVTTQRITLAVGDVNTPPVFNAKAFQGWTPQAQNGINNFLRTLNLRESVQIDLSAAFDDEDLINNDRLSYSISSNNGLTWSQKITGLALIDNNTLLLKPEGKESVGVQSIQLRATDLKGASNIQNLRLTVRNINDPPMVTRESAALLRAGVWQETVRINQGQSDWRLNLEGVFKDADAGDRIDQITPTDLPAWLSYTPSATNTGGVLSGTPGNSDVGIQTLQWQAVDDAGDTATYRLRLDVVNINDAPELRKNPDLSGLGKLINGSPSLNQNASGRVDLGNLFQDPDTNYGDALRYTIKSVKKEGTLLETIPEWLALSLEQAVAPDATGKVLIEPVLYRIAANGFLGDKVAPAEISQLSPGTALRVVVEATDTRQIERKGLVGVDIDITLSPSLSLVTDSAEMSQEFGFRRKVTPTSSGLRAQGSGAPDLGSSFGTPVGDKAKDPILTFDVQVNEPNKRVVIGLSTGDSETRDGLLDRQAKQLDQTDSIIHSFASKIFLDATKPNNDSVGQYEIVLTAEDLAGLKASKTLSLLIANINDAPLIDADGTKQSQLITQWLTYKQPEGAQASKSFNLFTDPDLKFEDSLSYEIIPGEDSIESATLKYPGSIGITKEPDGSLSLSLTAPRGLRSEIKQQFKLMAVDIDGLKTKSDWFNVEFKPIAEPTALIRGAEPLKASQKGGATKKNTSIDLQSVLNLNAITPTDTEGDEVILKLLAKQDEAIIKGPTSAVKKESTSEGTIFSIQMNQLGDDANGSLNGLQLELAPNQLELVPRQLIPKRQAGLALEVWTETRVKGDETKTFNIAITDRKTIWVPIENSTPVFTAPSLKVIDSNFFSSSDSDTSNPEAPGNPPLKRNQTLVQIKELFQDTDVQDQLEWELDVPRNLKGLIELDEKTGNVKLAESVKDLKDLPAGSHRLTVRAKDSSGQLGDSSGIRSGSIRLLVTPPEDASKAVKGLSHLTSLNVAGMSELFAKSPEQLDEKEKEAITILEKLNVAEKDRTAFAEKLEEGSVAVISNSNSDKPMLLIDTSMNTGEGDDKLKPILTDAAVEDANNEQVTASSSLLPTREIVDTPIGEIDFTVDSRGKDFSVVQLKMEDGGIDMDTLFKTTTDGTPFIFKSEHLSYSESDGPLDEWINELEYGLYYYDPNHSNVSKGSALITLNATDKSLAEKLLTNDPLFEYDDQVNRLDGSAYLIDLDGNKTVDLVSMLLVDEGWFDTKQGVLGVIGDPLIPASTKEVLQVINGSQGGANNSESTTESSNESPSEQTETQPQPQPPDKRDIPEEGNQTQDQSEPPKDPDSTASNSPSTATSEDQPNQDSANTPSSRTNRTLSPNLFGPKNEETRAYNQKMDNDVQNDRANIAASSTKQTRTRNEQQSPMQESPKILSNSFLDSVQQWMSTTRQQTSEALRSIIAPLQSPTETSIAAAFGMLALPLLTERSATRAAKAMDKDINLRLSRRDPMYIGRWKMLTRKGLTIVIERKGGLLSIKQFDTQLHQSPTNQNLNHQGNSLLSDSLKLCKKPGSFIRSLQALQIELTQTQTTDINWEAWFDHHFKDERRSKYSDKESAASLKELRSLIKKANTYEPAFADVLMLGQLIDCKEALGLEINLHSMDFLKIK